MLYTESPPNPLICVFPIKLLPSRQDTGDYTLRNLAGPGGKD